MDTKLSGENFKQLWQCHLSDIVKIGKSEYKVISDGKNRVAVTRLNKYHPVRKNQFVYVEVVGHWDALNQKAIYHNSKESSIWLSQGV